MPVIKSKEAIQLLQPELPQIKQLIERRNRQTGELALPLGLQTRLFAEQMPGKTGTKGARGAALYFDADVVNALLRELQQRRQQLRQRQQQQTLNSNQLLKLADGLGPQHASTQRALRRIVNQSLPVRLS